MNIVVVSPPNIPRKGMFDEVADTLRYGFETLGVDVTIRDNQIDHSRHNIILGGHRMHANDIKQLPDDAIIYNFQRLKRRGEELSEDQRNLLSSFRVWDHDQRNIDVLKTLPNAHVPQLVKLGFVPQLQKVPANVVQDIDVLFYGGISDRRRKIIAELEAVGLKVVTLFGLYGAKRDTYIARAKVVLNMHYRDDECFEIARVSYLLANSKAVVCEARSPAEVDGDLAEGMAVSSYGDLVTTCLELVQNDEKRLALESSALACFSARDQTDILKEIYPAMNDMEPAASGLSLVGNVVDMPVPKVLNTGSGEDFRAGCLNLDCSKLWDPDIVADLSNPKLVGSTSDTDRFSRVTLEEGMFERIICDGVLEQITDLVTAMTNCLKLLEDGGEVEIVVPYELSLRAWDHPAHVRAFNEHSWLYFTDWHWQVGWETHRFDLIKMNYKPGKLGFQMLEDGAEPEEMIRTPRAIEEMSVVLKKRPLTAAEKASMANRISRTDGV